MYLSVVIPAYNEAQRILPTLTRFDEWLAAQSRPYEVLVADDGSTDDTADVVRAFTRDHPAVRVAPHPARANHGKGHALKRVMAETTGAFVLYTDADLPVDPAALPWFLGPLEAGECDLTIASRWVNGAPPPDDVPGGRAFISKSFRLLMRPFVLNGIADTQCGFKAFRGNVARQLFAQLTIDRFAFDVELIYLAQRAGYRIREVPVRIHHADGSTVRPVRDSLGTLRDLARIKWNDQRGRYAQ
ncbi:MAG: glycosyltransferase family 2 protein [Chloroflexi bacterium]|nr:glycosyltransferase family 2 protein [Chloroflexota bacterium]MBU1747244.1 glycosyltransferase family 2 protein [Chloroflexota bacterium]MBU1879256.1 glycosyltransferase family 2 protein [Chloroflexota bacterium]